MTVHYILGRASSGKSDFVFEMIKERMVKGDGKRLFLFVPEQFTLQAERDLIEKIKLPGIMSVEVLSFTRLAYKVFSEVGGITKIFINDHGKNMILRKVIDEAQKDLVLYKKAAKQDGFVSKVRDALSDLKRHDVVPNDILKVLEDLGAENTGAENTLLSKFKDLTTIDERYSQYLSDRYIDMEDHINLLVDKIESSSNLKGSEIWIDGFNSFTPQTLRLIERLMLVADNIYITLTIDPLDTTKDREVFVIPKRTMSKLKGLAEKNNLAEKIITQKDNTDVNKQLELVHIEREFFSYPPQLYSDEVSFIEIFSGLNPFSEVENAAAQLVALVREKGYRWKDIAVVSNAMDTYGPLIERIFVQYEIPYFLDEKRNIMNNPIIELILSSLAVISRGYRYDDMFRFLKTGFAPLTVDQTEILENYVLKFGIKGPSWKEPFKFGSTVELESLNDIREEVVIVLEHLEKGLKGKKTVEEITQALYKFLESLKVYDQLEMWIEKLWRDGSYEYAHEYSQIWNLVIQTFDQLVEFMGDQIIPLKAYARVLEAGFADLNIGIIPTTIDQVLVGNLSRSKSHSIRVLMLLGVNDGVLPQGKGEEDLLLDGEKDLLAQKGFDMGSLSSDYRLAEEKLHIYSALAKPSDYMWVSFALADQEGKSLRPSLYIERMKKIFPQIKLSSDVIKDLDRQISLIATPQSTFKYLVENLRQGADRINFDDLWQEVYQWYFDKEGWKKSREMVIEGLFHKNQTKALGRKKAEKLFNLPLRTSVSRLEKFVQCPFAYFIRYGIKPEERKEFKVASFDVGEIFHTTIDNFIRNLNQEGIDWRGISKGQCYEIVDKVFDEYIPNYNYGLLLSTHRYKYMVKRLKRIGKRAMWTLTEHLQRGGFEPYQHEVTFGEKGNFPPLVLELQDGEKVFIEGRIDRVDLYTDEEGTYVKVVDYKSSSKDLNLSDIYHSIQLQLILYLEAVLQSKPLLTEGAIIPGGLFYFKIDDPMVKTDQELVESVEREIAKQLKMKGLVLKNSKVVRAMDREIDGYSEIITALMNKDGEVGKYKSVAIDDFSRLIKHVRDRVAEIAGKILDGHIRIEPCKYGKELACTYCEYKPICHFDTTFVDNEWRLINPLKGDQVLERLQSPNEQQVLVKGGEKDDSVD